MRKSAKTGRLCSATRVIALLVAVLVSFLPLHATTVSAMGTEEELSTPIGSTDVRNINLNIDGAIAGINNPDVPETNKSEWANGNGTTVLLGREGTDGLEFKVLSKNTDAYTNDGSKTMLLEAVSPFPGREFSEGINIGQQDMNEWNGSGLQAYLNGTDGSGVYQNCSHKLQTRKNTVIILH